ncbi:MAG: hypothetical protein NW226_23825 [Microscillaceae bacterium]|nr:hypothetical protein [Microscillaceae bacterium]
MKKYLFSLLFLLVFIGSTSAQRNKKDKTVRVSATIEVLMEGNYSKATLQEKAIQTARIQAIGQEFGYAIVQGINTQTKTTVGESVLTSSTLNEVSNTLVKGEWVSDEEGYPKTRFIIREKGDEQEIWLICEVRGFARAIEEAEVNFEAFAYNCREPEKCNSGIFKNHDSMFLYFKSPVRGYLSIFMWEEGRVYRLLPYASMEDEYESTVPVEADKEYFLFSPEHRNYFPGFALVDEYGLETYNDQESLSNFVYVIFSTKPFRKPLLEENEGIKSMALEDFQEWINENKGLNKEFQVKKFNIVVQH